MPYADLFKDLLSDSLRESPRRSACRFPNGNLLGSSAKPSGPIGRRPAGAFYKVISILILNMTIIKKRGHKDEK